MTAQPTIYFDLDGTVYPLYQQPEWLPRLRNSDPTAYAVETAMVDMVALHEVLLSLMDKGYAVGVISWLAKDASPAYNKAVRAVKREWIAKFLPMATEVHIVKYGTPKHRVANAAGILVDDVAEVREAWTRGATIDANGDIIAALRKVA